MTHYQHALDVSGGSIPYLEAMILCLMGSTYLEISTDLKEQVLHYHDQAEQVLANPMGVVMEAAAWVELGFCAALEYVEEAQAFIEDHQMRQIAPYVSLAMGKAHFANSDFDEAIADFSRAEETAFEMEMRPIVWQARASAAKAFQKSGRNGEAQEKRHQALDSIQEIERIFEDLELREAFSKCTRQELA